MSAPPYPYAPPFRPGAPAPPFGMGPPPGAGFPPGRGPPPHMGGPIGGMPPHMPFPGGLGPPRGIGGPVRPYGRGHLMPMGGMGGRPVSHGLPPSMPVVLPKPRPAVEKSTTVYVGKIASSVEDELIRSLLEACGKIKSWKRQEDPETKQLKGFGFCEFEDAEGVLRAIRLLNNVKLDGQELLLKGNSATQKYIEDYEATKEQKKREAKAKAESEKEQGELNEEEEDKDNAVLEKIMSIVTEREEQQRKKTSDSQRANDFLSKLDKKEQELPLPPPPRREHSSSERRESRDSRTAERELEREYEQRREQQRKKDESRQRELDRDYERLLKSWEQRERDFLKSRDMEKEHIRELERERARQIKADLEASDSEDEIEPWMRRSYRSSRRAEERRKRRIMEEREDDVDRRQEEKEGSERAKRYKQDSDQVQVKAEDFDAHDNGQPVKMEAEAKLELKEEVKEEVKHEPVAPAPAPAPEPQIDPNDPIYQAMMAAAKAAPSKPRSPPKAPVPTHVTPAAYHEPPVNSHSAHGTVASHGSQHIAQVQHQSTPGPGSAGPKSKKVNLLAMFGDDDEQEGNQRRKLVPLQYTEEEMKSVSQPAAAAEDPQTMLRKMMDTIPTKKDDVYAYKIKWDAYDVATMGTRVSTWVSKKVHEFLGMEEPTLVDFIMQMLSKRKSAMEMLGELALILDSDAPMFVLKLFRMLIYETEKANLGL